MADKAKKKDGDAIQVVQRNRKAFFHYEILEIS